MQDFFVWWI